MPGSPARLWRCAMSSDRSVAPLDELRLLPIVAGAEAAILALNNEHATELSWLDADRLASLPKEAFYARRIGDADAFLIAFDERATYDSPNYLWFGQCYTRFVYVDRVRCRAAAAGSRLRTPALRRPLRSCAAR